MLRIEVGAAEQRRLRAADDSTTTPWIRDRIEMISLAAEGWSAPAVAPHLGSDPRTVRRVLKSG
jgi:putative transposase